MAEIRHNSAHYGAFILKIGESIFLSRGINGSFNAFSVFNYIKYFFAFFISENITEFNGLSGAYDSAFSKNGIDARTVYKRIKTRHIPYYLGVLSHIKTAGKTYISAGVRQYLRQSETSGICLSSTGSKMHVFESRYIFCGQNLNIRLRAVSGAFSVKGNHIIPESFNNFRRKRLRSKNL